MARSLGTEGGLYRQVVAYKWSVLLVALVAGVSAFAFSGRQTPIYESSARVLVQPVDLPLPGAAEPPPLNLATEKEIAASIESAARVAQKLAPDQTAKQLLDDLSVEANTEANILTFNYRDVDRLQAARRAQAFSDVYLAQRRERASADSAAALATLRAEIKIVTRRIDRLNKKIARIDDKSRRAALESRSNLLNGLLIQKELARFPLKEEPDVGFAVERAVVPRLPVWPNPRLDAVLGLALGLMLGAGQAALRGRLTGRIWSLEHLERVLVAPVLGTVPEIPAKRGRSIPTIADRGAPPQLTESLRFLRAGVVSAAASHRAKVLLITSASRREGRTTIAINLAMALAKVGRHVVIVSADLRNPALDEALMVSGRAGLAEVLTGATPAWGALVPTVHDGLHVLPAGRATDNAGEMLGSDKMTELIAELRREVDYVVLDSAPVSELADSIALAPLADGVIFVADMRRTHSASVSIARQRLDKVGAVVLGGALDRVNLRQLRSRSYFETREIATIASDPADLRSR